MFWPELASVDPFASLRRLQRDMNRLIEAYGGEGRESFPAVNVWSSADEVLVKAEVPGIEPKDLDIMVQGDQLTLQGERKAEELSKDVVCHRAERGSGRFIRTFRLPFEVDNARVEAKYAHGILTIRLPRTETSKPRKIAISAEG